MTLNQLWYVVKTHTQQAINDFDLYAIKNGDDNIIASSPELEDLLRICYSHNKCFVDLE